MRKQALVIGLGQFGMAIVRSLSALDIDVMAVDKRGDRVRAAANMAAESAAFDATDEAALKKTAPDRRDVVVCAIGDEGREAAFLCTALLREMGAPRIVARGIDELHSRILGLIGAHEVVQPERAFGERLAAHLAFQDVLGEYPLSEGISVSELRAPEALVGRTLRELSLPRKHGVSVVALHRSGSAQLAPEPDEPLRDGDVLVLVSRRGGVTEMMKHFD